MKRPSNLQMRASKILKQPLRNLTENQVFLNIDKILKTNAEANKRQLQQQKFKTFIYLKYKPQPIKKQTPVITRANLKKSYANAVKGNTNIIDPKVQHLRKTSKANIQEEPPTLLKKLELLHPAHTQHHSWKSPTSAPSTKEQTSTDRDKEIEDLRNQIKFLKQNQKEHDTQEQPKHIENKEDHPDPQNIRVASASGGHTQTNINLLKVLNFVQETLEILSNYSEQLQTHLDINLTHQDM